MTEHALPGWIGAGEIDGVPLWRRASEPVYVAAADRDQLAFLDAALTLFDTAGPREFADFIERRGIPRHEPPGDGRHDAAEPMPPITYGCEGHGAGVDKAFRGH